MDVMANGFSIMRKYDMNTPRTFRHSYAMHMLYAGIPLKGQQCLMGHKSISSTEAYTKVFALDVAARHRAEFHMPGLIL